MGTVFLDCNTLLLCGKVENKTCYTEKAISEKGRNVRKSKLLKLQAIMKCADSEYTNRKLWVSNFLNHISD